MYKAIGYNNNEWKIVWVKDPTLKEFGDENIRQLTCEEAEMACVFLNERTTQ